MAALVILLIAGLAAMAVLLACLKGFSQALRYKKTSGVFVRVEDTRKRLPRSPSNTLVDFPGRKPQPDKRPTQRRISGGTVALMSLGIALGVRGASGASHAASFKGDNARVPAVQPLHKT